MEFSAGKKSLHSKIMKAQILLLKRDFWGKISWPRRQLVLRIN